MAVSAGVDVGPRSVFERFIRGVAEGRWDELADLYAEEALVEHPFHLPAPIRQEGREQVRELFAVSARSPLEMEPRNVVVHETGDPEVIVAEFEWHGRVTTTGRRYVVPNVYVMRVRSGEIVDLRVYGNHVAVAVATGQLPELVSALTPEEPT